MARAVESRTFVTGLVAQGGAAVGAGGGGGITGGCACCAGIWARIWCGGGPGRGASGGHGRGAMAGADRRLAGVGGAGAGSAAGRAGRGRGLLGGSRGAGGGGAWPCHVVWRVAFGVRHQPATAPGQRRDPDRATGEPAFPQRHGAIHAGRDLGVVRVLHPATGALPAIAAVRPVGLVAAADRGAASAPGGCHGRAGVRGPPLALPRGTANQPAPHHRGDAAQPRPSIAANNRRCIHVSSRLSRP